MRLANISNGLPFKHDGVSFFQSNHGHRAGMGYFRVDAMPYDAVIHLLKGGEVTVVDATRRHKFMTDAQKFGLPTWALIFNRAIRAKTPDGGPWHALRVASWQTPEMLDIARGSLHEPTVQSIRRLATILGVVRPVIVGQNLHIECHPGAIWDDKPRRIRDAMADPVHPAVVQDASDPVHKGELPESPEE